ncbi:hypothetical protein CDL15_Pgr006311 [Punica granatum]|uniref:Uncharacterized protein n=1 Tax=Punica granatum TaxID=22663 RepID=A0A218WA62_PUNGR|nr:hypothetical protein CDL15_Pgr006311 [Punica granatum]
MGLSPKPSPIGLNRLGQEICPAENLNPNSNRVGRKELNRMGLRTSPAQNNRKASDQYLGRAGPTQKRVGCLLLQPTPPPNARNPSAAPLLPQPQHRPCKPPITDTIASAIAALASRRDHRG